MQHAANDRVRLSIRVQCRVRALVQNCASSLRGSETCWQDTLSAQRVTSSGYTSNTRTGNNQFASAVT